MNRTTISVSPELRKRLSALKGEKTWDEFLSELLNLALERRVAKVEEVLRSSAGNRDIPFEKLKLRFGDEEFAR
ncbi:MAG: hypothetical protein QXN15_10145 [Candidatus Jordarchaeales archaeon]|nr:hypothetical protein [Candidatus Jordarchaeia archaeon]